MSNRTNWEQTGQDVFMEVQSFRRKAEGVSLREAKWEVVADLPVSSYAPKGQLR